MEPPVPPAIFSPLSFGLFGFAFCARPISRDVAILTCIVFSFIRRCHLGRDGLGEIFPALLLSAGGGFSDLGLAPSCSSLVLRVVLPLELAPLPLRRKEHAHGPCAFAFE